MDSHFFSSFVVRCFVLQPEHIYLDGFSTGMSQPLCVGYHANFQEGRPAPVWRFRLCVSEGPVWAWIVSKA